MARCCSHVGLVASQVDLLSSSCNNGITTIKHNSTYLNQSITSDRHVFPSEDVLPLIAIPKSRSCDSLCIAILLVILFTRRITICIIKIG